MMVVLPLPCQALQQGAGLKAEQLELELTGIWVAGATAKSHCAVMPNPEMSFSFIYSFFPQYFFSYLKAEQEKDRHGERDLSSKSSICWYTPQNGANSQDWTTEVRCQEFLWVLPCKPGAQAIGLASTAFSGTVSMDWKQSSQDKSCHLKCRT